jgi:hypothetical protein
MIRSTAGVPHSTASDDVYEDYFTSKGLYSERTNLFRC